MKPIWIIISAALIGGFIGEVVYEGMKANEKAIEASCTSRGLVVVKAGSTYFCADKEWRLYAP